MPPDFDAASQDQIEAYNKDICSKLEVDATTETLSEAIIWATKRNIPTKVSYKDWYNRKKDQLLKFTEARNLAEEKLQKERSDEKCKNAQIARRALKREIRIAKEEWVTEQLRIIEGVSNFDARLAAIAMDRLIQGLEGNRKIAGGEKLKRSDGSFTNSDKERNEEFKSFFSKGVFGRVSSYNESALDEIDDREIDFQLNTPPSFEEFAHHTCKRQTDTEPLARTRSMRRCTSS